VKLLLDQNLSSRLVGALDEVFPGSAHVRQFGLATADDGVVWRFARENAFMLLSKDTDFLQLSFLHGAPPKVIHVRAGNCSTREVLNLVLMQRARIHEFERDGQAATLVLLRE
jgi:predicted nuclease of predicted toxin-antitoxin system